KTGTESYLYTGKKKDETGLYYYGARYYDPELGRFLTRDPLAGKKVVPQSLNRYTYCLNNPVKFIDPAGMFYKMCHVDGGCRWVRESRSSSDPDRPDWVAYDANGDKITDSDEMETLLTSDDKADQAKAVYLMFLVTHPEIQGDPTQMGDPYGPGYLFNITIEGEDIPLWIYISDEFADPKGNLATTNLTKIDLGDGILRDGIHLTVYQGAFQSLAHLYHVIGHEGCHVYDLITTGGNISDAELEFNGYMWNLNHANGLFPYPWDKRELTIKILHYAVLVLMERIPR
ncbi:MAG: RHS repeat-associated core domain-containing protein, partial [Candidatus Methanofastidiosia archaeon]